MSTLEWKDVSLRIRGSYYGMIKYMDCCVEGENIIEKPSYFATMIMPADVDTSNVDVPFNGDCKDTVKEALQSACDIAGIDSNELTVTPMHSQCHSLDGFYGQVESMGRVEVDPLDPIKPRPILFRASCLACAWKGPVILGENMTYEAAKVAVEKAYEIHKDTVSAVLKATKEIREQYAGNALSESTVERVIREAAEISHSLPKPTKDKPHHPHNLSSKGS